MATASDNSTSAPPPPPRRVLWVLIHKCERAFGSLVWCGSAAGACPRERKNHDDNQCWANALR
eukprot:5161845-Lingulodinium_polyedra.AAC.1